MDPKRERRVVGLHDRRIDGLTARERLSKLEPILEQTQRDLLQELIKKTDENGAIAAAEVWQLVALEKVVQRLVKPVIEGKVAERKLEKLRQSEIGGDDG